MKKRKLISILILVCMVTTILAGMTSIGGTSVSAAAVDPNGRYITFKGAGLKNGTSWENAWGYDTKSFRSAWDSTPSNGTLYVGSGTYIGATINVRTYSDGQSETFPKRLVGVDTGEGKPVVRGTYTPTSGTSPKFFDIDSGVCYVGIENMRIENYFYAIRTGYKNEGIVGNSTGISVKNCDFYVTEHCIYLDGAGTEGDSIKLSNVFIENCNFYYYTKTGIKSMDRVEDVLVSNCYADAGGINYWYPGNWPTGFLLNCETGTLAERRFTFVDCVAVNSYHNNGTEYWNADGFTTERGAYDITYIRCKAFGSTDGGWDCKGENLNLIDCIAMDNKRNFRFWGTTFMTNCLSSYSYKRGGSSSSVGMWVSKSGGNVTANFSTFFNNAGAQIETEGGGRVTLNDCIVGANISGRSLYSGSGTVNKNRTEDYLPGNGTNPQINVSDKVWFYGDSAKYNSIFGASKGYYWKGYPDKSGLYAKIEEARDLYYIAAANIGTGIGKYSSSAVSALLAATTAAEDVYYYNYSATQSLIDSTAAGLQATISECAPIAPTPTPVPTPTPEPEPTIPADRISVNNDGTISNPYGKIGINLVRVDVTGIFDPVADNKTVMVNGIEAKYTKYNNTYKFVALSYGTITPDTVLVITKTPAKLVYGDLNMSETVESTDMNLLKGALAKNRTPASNFEYLAADVNGDGELTSTDMNLLKGFLAGNLLVLPIMNQYN